MKRFFEVVGNTSPNEADTEAVLLHDDGAIEALKTFDTEDKETPARTTAEKAKEMAKLMADAVDKKHKKQTIKGKLWSVGEPNYGCKVRSSPASHQGIKKSMRVRSISSGRLGVVKSLQDGFCKVESLAGCKTEIWEAPVAEVRLDARADLVRPGDLVHVRPDIEVPAFNWGFLKEHRSVGVVEKVSRAVVDVNFGHSKCRHGALEEFQVLQPRLQDLVVGAHVRLKKSLKDFHYGCGLVRQHSVGIIKKVEGDYKASSWTNHLACPSGASGIYLYTTSSLIISGAVGLSPENLVWTFGICF